MVDGWHLDSRAPKKKKHTPSGFDHSIHLVTSIHRAQIEELDSWSSICQLGSIVWRGSKLLEDLPANACRRLLHLDKWAVAKIALHEQDHLVVPHQDLAAADVVEPALHRRFDAVLVLIGACSGGSHGRRDSWHESLRIGGDEMLTQLDELGMQPPDISILGGSERGQVCLWYVNRPHQQRNVRGAYVNVEAKDRVLLPGPFQARNLGLQPPI